MNCYCNRVDGVMLDFQLNRLEYETGNTITDSDVDHATVVPDLGILSADQVQFCRTSLSPWITQHTPRRQPRPGNSFIYQRIKNNINCNAV